ncbi:MAG: nprV [Frankiales bacterium]|nr:nprV [Frankiales bacterium]
MRSSLACIVPPDLLLELTRRGTEQQRHAAADTLALDLSLRSLRAEAGRAPAPVRGRLAEAAGGTPRRTIHDQAGSEDVHPGRVVRTEGGPPTGDPAADEAYDGLGATYRFYWEVLARDSIDDRGLPLAGLVHYGTDYDNAFWDGEGHMVFGDGDGHTFTRFTASLDVIGHELTHGVTQDEAGLTYSGQSGALNESLSDEFGVLVAQYAKGQTAEQADWLIGADVVGPDLAPALRSLKAPGTANRYDRQPADMDAYVTTTTDNGGVHTNSGIPNHAFYVAATTLGGPAWERAGRVWYDALRDPALRPGSGFRAFARATVRQAQARFGTGSAEEQAVQAGWDAVKLTR